MEPKGEGKQQNLPPSQRRHCLYVLIVVAESIYKILDTSPKGKDELLAEFVRRIKQTLKVALGGINCPGKLEMLCCTQQNISIFTGQEARWYETLADEGTLQNYDIFHNYVVIVTVNLAHYC